MLAEGHSTLRSGWLSFTLFVLLKQLFFSGSRVGHVVFERSTSRAGYSWTRTTVVDRFNTKLIPNLFFVIVLYK